MSRVGKVLRDDSIKPMLPYACAGPEKYLSFIEILNQVAALIRSNRSMMLRRLGIHRIRRDYM